MTSSSRTYKSILNSSVALIIFFINLLLQFVSRKVFIVKLGTEVLGLNTTATNLLQFLNLAELGVGAAITYALYAPLAAKDHNTINEIISLQGWLYRKIACIVIAGAIVLMAFFPWIFSKMELPLWYAYASFCVLLFSALLSYFINYKEVLLTANQQEYKIQYSYRVVLLIKIPFQILFIEYLDNGYVWWMVLEVVFSIIASLILNMVIAKSCPYLSTDIIAGKSLRKKYPIIVTKIKQFFFHKIAIFILTQTSSIIIYAFTTLTMVAVYGNYMLIVNGIVSLLNAVFNGMSASVGNLVAENNKNNIIKVFSELFTSRFFIVTLFAYGIYMLANPFISLWIGNQYVLDKYTLFLIALTFYITTMRSVVDSFINAYGLFKDIWAPIVEAVLNLSCSIILGYYYGLQGILLGVIISLIIIVFLWKPYFLFKHGIGYTLTFYVNLYIKHLMVLIFVLLTCNLINSFLLLRPDETITCFILYGVFVMSFYMLLLFGGLYLTQPSMQYLVKRFIRK